MKKLLAFLTVIAFFVAGCVKTEPVSPVPHIAFESIEVFYAYDTVLDEYILAGELVFNFIDGDADIGIYPEEVDTMQWNRENYNVFLIPFEKIDSVYHQVPLEKTKPPPWYTIQHDTKLDRVGQNRTIKGSINLMIYDLPVYDSMRYDFYITDRAGNESNVESTTDFSSKLELPFPN